MRKYLAVSAALGFFAAVVAACSSDSPAPPFPDVPSFCTAKATAECQVALTCGAVDGTACQTTRLAACNADAAAATMTGARKYTQPNAQACIDKVKGAYGSGKVLLADLEGGGSITDLCARVFQGSVANDMPCTSDYDCTDNRICALVSQTATARVCAAPAPVAAGAFCANPGSQCATGTYCAQGAGGALCTPRAAVGGACSATQPCIEGTRCAGTVCAAAAVAGSACTQDSDCGPTAGYCDPYAGKCTVGLTFATGSTDCNGYGQGSSTIPADAGVLAPDSGVTPDGGGAPDANVAADAGASTDAVAPLDAASE